MCHPLGQLGSQETKVPESSVQVTLLYELQLEPHMKSQRRALTW
jgi:hypothetical protein